MFFVVFCEDWCSTVPENWIFVKEQVVKWPPKNDNVTAACKKNIKPNKNWLTKKYTRLFGPYKTFDIAREVEIATVNISTSDEASFIKESQTKEDLPKRTKKLPARYHDSSDHSSSNSNDDIEELNEKRTGSTDMNNFGFKSTESDDINIEDNLLDTQPLDYGDFFEDQNNNSQKEVNMSEKPLVLNVEILDIPYKPREIIALKQNRTQEGNASSSDAPQKSSALHVNNSVPIFDNLNDPAAKLSNQKKVVCTNEQPIVPCSQGCCSACRSQLHLISRKLDIIIMNFNSLHSDKTTQISQNTLLNALPQFAIDEIENLNQFNTTLTNNEEARSQFIKLITFRGGSGGKKMIRDILSYIITDELSCKLSWSGQKNTIAVKKMKFIEILTDTIASISDMRVTVNEINQSIMTWLQHGSDRVKYKNKKHEADN